MKASRLAAAFDTVPAAWAAILPDWTRERCEQVGRSVEAVSDDREIAPEDPFRALRLVAPDAVRVVILGQDPYPTAGHADGLAFSAGQGRPRSLARIFEVLAADRPGFVPPAVWRLDAWAHQGVLLLNPVLSVEVGRSASHEACGWQALTSQIVLYLSRRAAPPMFLVWGAKAQAFFAASADTRGLAGRVLVTRHPSYDFERRFMADGSHFAATAHLVDWWEIGSFPGCVL